MDIPGDLLFFFYGKLGNCGSGDRREMEGGNRRLGVSGNCGQDVNGEIIKNTIIEFK